MTRRALRLRLPDGSVLDVGPEAVLGRSSAATVRLADPRVSTVHAEISWREEGPLLLARGGRLLVGGAPVEQVLLAPGLVVALAPGVHVVVEAVDGSGVAPVPPSAGRTRLRWSIDAAGVTASRLSDGGSVVTLTGVGGRLVAALVRAGGPVAWDALAAALWPDEAAVRARGATGAPDDWTEVDERRLRNRLDQAVRAVRLQLAPLAGGRAIVLQGGTVVFRPGRGDEVDDAGAPPAPAGPG